MLAHSQMVSNRENVFNISELRNGYEFPIAQELETIHQVVQNDNQGIHWRTSYPYAVK